MNVEMDALYGEADAPTNAPIPADMFDVDPNEVTVTLLALHGTAPAGHAALRPHQRSLEVKKVFVDTAYRGRGIARMLMESLETVASEQGIGTLVLQTGDLQHDAIRLYERLGYYPIPPFRNYGLLARGLCYSKALSEVGPRRARLGSGSRSEHDDQSRRAH
jgi:GNAT superfamily N-acetyltransferase